MNLRAIGGCVFDVRRDDGAGSRDVACESIGVEHQGPVSAPFQLVASLLAAPYLLLESQRLTLLLTAATQYADGFSWPASLTGDESDVLTGVTRWRVEDALALFNGEVAHYYRTSGTVTCSADALIPATMQTTYSSVASQSAVNYGYDLTNWDCYCLDFQTLADQAELELLGSRTSDGVLLSDSGYFRSTFLWEDWSTYAPFDSR